jgi:hypothetical protein
MKTKVKKLDLKKDVLVKVGDSQLGRVAGGSIIYTCTNHITCIPVFSDAAGCH